MSTAAPGGASFPATLEHCLRLPLVTDPRGALLPVDFEALPFVPQRLFVVRDVPVGQMRGGHAHGSAWQLLLCLGGRIRVELRANGGSREVLLEGAGSALLVEPGTWASQTYLDPDSALLVLASERYDPASYRDHAD